MADETNPSRSSHSCRNRYEQVKSLFKRSCKESRYQKAGSLLHAIVPFASALLSHRGRRDGSEADRQVLVVGIGGTTHPHACIDPSEHPEVFLPMHGVWFMLRSSWSHVSTGHGMAFIDGRIAFQPYPMFCQADDRRTLYRDHPDGLRPSVVSTAMANACVRRSSFSCNLGRNASRRGCCLRRAIPKEVLLTYLEEERLGQPMSVDQVQELLEEMERDGLLRGSWNTNGSTDLDVRPNSDSSHSKDATNPTNRPPISENPGRDRIWTAFGMLLVTLIMGLLGCLAQQYPIRTAFEGVPFIVGSYGTLSILFFCTPSSPLIRGWNLLAGHVLCCTVAVSCMQFLPGFLSIMGIADTYKMAFIRSASMAISTYLMLKFNAVHPPGGALIYLLCDSTAFQQMKWSYIMYPGLTGALILVSMIHLYKRIFVGPLLSGERNYPP